MIRSRFLFGPLFDEANGDPNGGGGNPAPPAPAPAAPAFDPTAFRTELKSDLLNEIRRDINGIDKKFNKQFETFGKDFGSRFDQLFERLKPADPVDPPSDPNPPAPAGNNNQPPAPPAPQPHKPSPEVLRLQKQLEEMQSTMKANDEAAKAAKQEAAKKEMYAALKSEISRHKFATDRDPVDMFKLLASDIQQGEDGNYYGPDGITLEELVRNEWTARPNWQPARPVNGAGAPAPSGVINGKATFDLDQIGPNMTPEQRAAALAAMRQYIKR